MAVLDIVTLPDKILRRRTQAITQYDDELQKLIDHMIDTMRDAPGVGLAAPQVNRSIKLTVIETLADVDDDGHEIEGTRDLYVITNPEIVWTSRKMIPGIEGCLSIPGYVGEVDRYESIRVRAQDRYGKKIKLRLNGWTARIFQHEIDHLNGILYIDRLTEPENLWTEEEFEAMQDAPDLEEDAQLEEE
jgi:peptide deformylase